MSSEVTEASRDPPLVHTDVGLKGSCGRSDRRGSPAPRIGAMRLITQLAPRDAPSLPLLLVLFALCATAQWSDERGVNLHQAHSPS